MQINSTAIGQRVMAHVTKHPWRIKRKRRTWNYIFSATQSESVSFQPRLGKENQRSGGNGITKDKAGRARDRNLSAGMLVAIEAHSNQIRGCVVRINPDIFALAVNDVVEGSEPPP